MALLLLFEAFLLLGFDCLLASSIVPVPFVSLWVLVLPLLMLNYLLLLGFIIYRRFKVREIVRERDREKERREKEGKVWLSASSSAIFFDARA